MVTEWAYFGTNCMYVRVPMLSPGVAGGLGFDFESAECGTADDYWEAMDAAAAEAFDGARIDLDRLPANLQE